MVYKRVSGWTSGRSLPVLLDRNRNGGGVALYIRNSINYRRLIDLPDDNIELISIQVSKPKAKPFIVCTWYRPPGSTTELMNRFEDVLQNLDSYHMEVDIIGKMNDDMNLIQSWLSTNKLTLNVKKTKYMLIGSQFKLSHINSDFTVNVNNTTLERVIKHKSLGVQIDESLNWRPHIHTILKKISAGIAILMRVSHL